MEGTDVILALTKHEVMVIGLLCIIGAFAAGVLVGTHIRAMPRW